MQVAPPPKYINSRQQQRAVLVSTHVFPGAMMQAAAGAHYVPRSLPRVTKAPSPALAPCGMRLRASHNHASRSWYSPPETSESVHRHQIETPGVKAVSTTAGSTQQRKVGSALNAHTAPYAGTAGLGEAIRSAQSLGVLLSILEHHHTMQLQCRHTGDLDAVNLSALSSRLVHFYKMEPGFREQLSPGKPVDPAHRQPCTPHHALSTASRTLRMLLDLAVTSTTTLRPRQLSSILWSVARIAEAAASHSSTTRAHPDQQPPPTAPPSSPQTPPQPKPSEAGVFLHHHGLNHPFTHLSHHMCTTASLMARGTPMDLTQLMYAHALLGLPVPAEDAAQLWLATQRTFASFQPQDWSMAVYSMGVLQQRPPLNWLLGFAGSSLPHLHRFTSQGLSNTIWGLAVLRHHPGEPWLQAFLQAAEVAVPFMRDKELANTAWSIAQLCPPRPQPQPQPPPRRLFPAPPWEVQPQEAPPPAAAAAITRFMSAVETEAALRVPTMAVRDTASLLWSMARLRHKPGRTLMDQLAQHLPRQLQLGGQQFAHGRSQHLSAAPSPSGTSPHSLHAPHGTVSHGAMKGGGSGGSRHGLGEQGESPWAQVNLQGRLSDPHPPSASGRLVGAHPSTPTTYKSRTPHQALHAAGKDSPSNQTLCTLLWALARLRVAPPPGLLPTVMGHLGARLHSCSAQDLSTAMYSLSLLRLCPHAKWMVRFQAAVRLRLHTSTPAQLCMILLSLAKLRIRPERCWLDWMLLEVGRQLPLLSPRDMAHLCQALGTLGFRPSPPWVAAFCAHSALLLPSLSAHQLCVVAHSLAHLRLRVRRGGDGRGAHTQVVGRESVNICCRGPDGTTLAMEEPRHGRYGYAAADASAASSGDSVIVGCLPSEVVAGGVTLGPGEVPGWWVQALREAVKSRAAQFQPHLLYAAVRALSLMEGGLWGLAEARRRKRGGHIMLHGAVVGCEAQPHGEYVATTTEGGSIRQPSRGVNGGVDMPCSNTTVSCNGGLDEWEMLFVDAASVTSLCLLAPRWVAGQWRGRSGHAQGWG